MNKYIVAILGLGLMFTACNQSRLDIPQKGVSSIEDFYKTDADAESALVAAYDGFFTNILTTGGNFNRQYAIFNVLSDDYIYGGKNQTDHAEGGHDMSEFRFDANYKMTSEAYEKYYYANYSANLVIDHFGGELADSQTKKRCVAEARVMRAYYHTMLALGWGTPPIVDHVLPGDAKPSNSESKEQVLTWAADECVAAAADLDERKDPSDKNGSYKITKGFAQALAGKAYFYAKEYDKAKVELKKVIDSKKYELVPGEQWHDLFHVPGDGASEKVFELNALSCASYTSIRGYWNNSHTMGWRSSYLATQPAWMPFKGWGAGQIDQDFAQKMLDNEGDSPRRKGTFMTEDEFLYEMNWYKGCNDMTQEEKEADAKRGIAELTGLYGVGKFLSYKKQPNVDDVDKLNPGGHIETNYQIMRYAEVLLLYAQACAHTSDADGSGLKALNEVQTRAGAPTTTLSIENVVREKGFELWNEGCRWIDMIHYNDFAGVVNKGTDVPTLRDKYFTDKTGKHELFVVIVHPNEGVEHGFKAGKHELFPFPANVLKINPNLKQNPGWD